MPEGSGERTVPISGPLLTLPPGRIFHVCRAGDTDYQIGEFRAWAGYRNLGSDTATAGLAHFQHVLSFAGTEAAGRTGVHCHLAHAHIILPTSGRGIFSYDGVVTEAVPGMVIVQHGGTVHDQFNFTYAAGSEAENRRTPQTLERPPPGAPARSFGFLELFVPLAFANVEIVPPEAVTAEDQASAWAHPYHLPGARFFVQAEEDAVYRPLAGAEGLEARDAGTWGPTAELVATWIIRPAEASAARGPAMRAEIPDETGGVEILYLVEGWASFRSDDGKTVRLEAGEAATVSQGVLGAPVAWSPDVRLLRLFIAARAQDLRARAPEEIARLEALGPAIITRREVRPDDDTRPVNFLQDKA